MKKKCALFILFICLWGVVPVKAQRSVPLPKVMIVPAGDAGKNIGEVVEVHLKKYSIADNGKVLRIYLDPLTLMLTGKSRKDVLSDLLIRRKLNREVKAPLDTSIMATGKIMLLNGRPVMQFSQGRGVYIGPIVEAESPGVKP